MATRLDETTNIPLFAALAALPIIIGFIFWLTSIDSKAQASIDVNAAQDIKIEQARDILVDIRERIIRIETKLDNDKK
jgi:hypothetical protein